MNTPNQPEQGVVVDTTEPTTAPKILWGPLTRNQRRVAGVLVEKSKTTADIYPMTINAIKTGSNQKSNRSPQLDLREDQVEDVLYELRHLGAVIEVQSSGRVPKYKHELYEWLGVDRVELAVMAELLLRGAQTLGDLRGRASRMDKIAGLSELKPIVEGLIEKNLIIELTPPGRGQIVTHNLYQADELERLRKEYADYASESSSSEPSGRTSPAQRQSPTGDADDARLTESSITESSITESSITKLTEEVGQLRQMVNESERALSALQAQVAEIQEMLK